MKKIQAILIPLLAFTLGLSSCGKANGNQPVEVENITLNKSSITLLEGTSENLVATVTPENADDKTVTWTSANPTVATVDNQGKVTGRKEGSTVVNAAAGNFNATCNVTVNAVVIPKALQSLNVTPPNKTTYYIGEALDTAGLIVRAKFDDGSTQQLTSTQYTITGFDSSIAVANLPVTVSYTYENVTKSSSFNVTILENKTVTPTVTSIEINHAPNKTTYEIGDELDTNGLIVIAHYSDDSQKQVTGYTLSGFDSSKAGEVTVTVTYEGQSASFKVTINQATPDVVITGIEVTTKPTKQEYELNETLDTAGLVVKAIYSDNTKEEITGYTVSALDSSTTGKKIITVSFVSGTETFTATFEVTVLAAPTLESIIIDTAKAKLEYELNEELDTSGLVITAHYNRGADQAVSLSNCTFTGYNKSQSGEQVITVTYNNISATYKVTVKEETQPATLVSIAITTPPTKVNYEVGDEFNPAGFVITATYSDQTTKKIDTGYTLSDVDMSTSGTKTVTVTYEEKTTSFDIIVVDKDNPVTLVSIAITTNPAKTEYYVGDTFTSEGLVVTSTYSDGSISVVTGYTLSEVDMNTTGSKTVTVTYLDKTNTFEITVSEAPVTYKDYILHIKRGSADWEDIDLTINPNEENEYMLENSIDLEADDLLIFHMTGDDWRGYSDIKDGGAKAKFTKESEDSNNIKVVGAGKYQFYIGDDGIYTVRNTYITGLSASYEDKYIVVGDHFDADKFDVRFIYDDDSKGENLGFGNENLTFYKKEGNVISPIGTQTDITEEMLGTLRVYVHASIATGYSGEDAYFDIEVVYAHSVKLSINGGESWQNIEIDGDVNLENNYIATNMHLPKNALVEVYEANQKVISSGDYDYAESNYFVNVNGTYTVQKDGYYLLGYDPTHQKVLAYYNSWSLVVTHGQEETTYSPYNRKIDQNEYLEIDLEAGDTFTFLRDEEEFGYNGANEFFKDADKGYFSSANDGKSFDVNQGQGGNYSFYLKHGNYTYTAEGDSVTKTPELYVTKNDEAQFEQGSYYVVGDHDYSSGVSAAGASWNDANKAKLMTDDSTNVPEGFISQYKAVVTFNVGDNFKLRTDEYLDNEIENAGALASEDIEISEGNIVVNTAGTYDIYLKIRENDTYSIYIGLRDLTLDNNSLTIDIGSQKTVNASNYAGELSATSNKEDIATVSVDQETGEITITGVAYGDAVIEVSAGGFTKSINVTVTQLYNVYVTLDLGEERENVNILYDINGSKEDVYIDKYEDLWHKMDHKEGTTRYTYTFTDLTPGTSILIIYGAWTEGDYKDSFLTGYDNWAAKEYTVNSDLYIYATGTFPAADLESNKAVTYSDSTSNKLLTDITLDTSNAISAFERGSAFDPAGLVVTATYNDGPDSEIALNNANLTFAYNFNNVGKATVTVTYKENGVSISKSYEVNVTLTLDSITVTHLPTKINYDVGDIFDSDGLVITAYYKDGSSQTVTPTSISSPDMSSSGSKTVTVTYTENEITKQITFTISVAVSLTGIEITSAPTKTTYVVGEQFDSTGLVVIATYSNEDEVEIHSYQLSGFDSSNPVANQTITVTYEGKTVTFTVKIIQISSITVTAPDKTEYYVGEQFVSTGLVVTATYNDVSTRQVTGYTLTDENGNTIDMSTAGTKTVKVTYVESNLTKTATFTINVFNYAYVVGIDDNWSEQLEYRMTLIDGTYYQISDVVVLIDGTQIKVKCGEVWANETSTADGAANITIENAGVYTIYFYPKANNEKYVVLEKIGNTLKVSSSSVNLALGGSDAEITVSDASGAVSVTSSNEEIATATINGNKITIHAVGKGDAKITVSADNRNSCEIEVNVVELYQVTFLIDLSSISGWEPTPENASIYIELNDETKLLGDLYSNENKGNLTIENNIASIEVSVANGKSISSIKVYFYQNNVAKTSNEISVNISAAGDYVIDLGPLTSWDGNDFSGATCGAKQLVLDKDSVAIQLNGSDTVNAKFWTGTLSIKQGYDNEKINVTLNSETGVITITGLALGTTTLTISDGNVDIELEVTVEAVVYRWYVAGVEGDWTAGKEGYQLEADPNDINHFVITGIEVYKGNEIKVVDVISNPNIWFGNNGENYTFTTDSGTYRIDFYVIADNGIHIVATRTGDLTSLQVSKTSSNLVVGGDADTVTASNVTGTLTATSNDTDIATVAVTGSTITITPVAAGSTTITVSDDSKVTRTINVVVIEASVVVTVYFTDGKLWDNISAYVWNSETYAKVADWPGTSATYVYTNDFGQNVYSVTIDTSLYNYVIFTNGSNQTVDIEISLGMECNAVYVADSTDGNGHYNIGWWSYNP